MASLVWSQDDLTTYILVRQADRTGGEDVLSEKGEIRARELSRVLEYVDLDMVYCSDYRRTRATVDPMLRQKGMEATIYNAKDIPGFVETLESHQGKTVLIVGHSNTVPQTINMLGVSPPVPDLNHDQYDRLYIVSRSMTGDTRLVTLQFGEDTP